MALEAFTARLGPFALLRGARPVEADTQFIWAPTASRLNATFTIGRLPDSDLPLEDPSVSKRHAELRWSNGRCVVVDLDSMNGTLVNDFMVKGTTALQDGDTVEFGEIRFVYLLTASLYRLLGVDLDKTQPEYRPAPLRTGDDASTVTARIPLEPELPPIRRERDPHAAPTAVVPIITPATPMRAAAVSSPPRLRAPRLGKEPTTAPESPKARGRKPQ
jgi:predicted component of type VI protein secretion system